MGILRRLGQPRSKKWQDQDTNLSRVPVPKFQPLYYSMGGEVGGKREGGISSY